MRRENACSVQQSLGMTSFDSKSLLLVVLLAVLPRAADADRISDMNPTELCTYVARLKVLAYYYYGRGVPRAEVKVHWKGDETANEVDFVNRTIDEAYAWLSAMQAEPGKLSEQRFGDMVYEACISGTPL
jgi:hypothetical protein